MNITKVDWIRYVLMLILMSYLLVQTIVFVQTVIFNDSNKVTRCGIVTFKGNSTQVNKHSSDIQFIMVLQYDDTGRRETETVSAATWSSYEVGSKLCLLHDKSKSFIEVINFIVGAIGLASISLTVLILLGSAIYWITTGESLFIL
jgi:hypothetical protein